MLLSRILMILALAILAYLVWITMSDCDTFKNEKKKIPQENFVQVQEVPVVQAVQEVQAPVAAPVPAPIEHFIQEQIVYAPVEQVQVEHFEVPTEPSQPTPLINYEQTHLFPTLFIEFSGTGTPSCKSFYFSLCCPMSISDCGPPGENRAPNPIPVVQP